MNENISYRWLESPTQEEWLAIDSLLEKHHWMSLSPDFSKVLVAEADGEIVGISCIQAIPFVGPLLVLPKWRGTGVAERLADDTIGSLRQINARGWLVLAGITTTVSCAFACRPVRRCSSLRHHSTGMCSIRTDCSSMPTPQEIQRS
jgi:hypothetical protein